MASMIQENETIEVPAVGEGKARVVSRKILAEIIEARVEEMYSMIQQEINKSGFGELLAAGIVLTGGTTLLQGMVELGDFLFEVPLKRGVPIRLGGLREVVNSPKYSTAVGLLKHGADQMGRGSSQASGLMGENLLSGDGVIGKIGGSMKNWMKDLF